MKDRIKATFEHLAEKQRTALIPYVTSGFPTREATVPLMHAMSDAGADIIELGMPFSDPMADGPVIQQSNDVALANGIGASDVLEIVREFRREDGRTPVVLMGYANPIEAMGVSQFVEAARSAGVDGLLVVDRPPEESDEFAQAVRGADMCPIFLLAPTSTEERIDAVSQIAGGYVYYVSLKGVTGAGHLDVDDVQKQVQRIRRHVSLPVGVGFGIRDPETARAIAEYSDAVVIGSRIIQLLQEQSDPTSTHAVREFIGDVRAALDELAVEKGDSR